MAGFVKALAGPEVNSTSFFTIAMFGSVAIVNFTDRFFLIQSQKRLSTHFFLFKI